MSAARRFTVRGRVQGVFFRDSTRRVADTLDVRGYAINLPNGDVEVLACGSAAAVDALAEFLNEGPPIARVDEVRVALADDYADQASWPAAFTTG